MVGKVVNRAEGVNDPFGDLHDDRVQEAVPGLVFKPIRLHGFEGGGRML